MKISWYDHLYVGDKAKKKRYQIIQSIRNSRLISGAYVITPSLSGNNVLDIYPAMELSAPWYKKNQKEHSENESQQNQYQNSQQL